MLIVTFPGQTGEMVVELVIAVIAVVTVDTTVDVEVAVSTPPKGANRRIVDSGEVAMDGPPNMLGGGCNVGGDPTTQASLDVIM